MQRHRIWWVLATSLLILAVGRPAVAQVTVVPYGSSGFRFTVTTGPFPQGVELPGFDDSGWPSGTAPFSSGEFPGGVCSPAFYSPVTLWPAATNLVARLSFMLPGTASGGLLRFGIDNDVSIFLNGQQIASVLHENCANHDDFLVPIPDGVLQPGVNLLVALGVDRGGISGFDVAVTADAVTATTPRSWGGLKTIYR